MQGEKKKKRHGSPPRSKGKEKGFYPLLPELGREKRKKGRGGRCRGPRGEERGRRLGSISFLPQRDQPREKEKRVRTTSSLRKKKKRKLGHRHGFPSVSPVARGGKKKRGRTAPPHTKEKKENKGSAILSSLCFTIKKKKGEPRRRMKKKKKEKGNRIDHTPPFLFFRARRLWEKGRGKKKGGPRTVETSSVKGGEKRKKGGAVFSFVRPYCGRKRKRKRFDSAPSRGREGTGMRIALYSSLSPSLTVSTAREGKKKRKGKEDHAGHSRRGQKRRKKGHRTEVCRADGELEKKKKKKGNTDDDKPEKEEGPMSRLLCLHRSRRRPGEKKKKKRRIGTLILSPGQVL